MSRAFVKKPDNNYLENQPIPLTSDHPNDATPTGMKQIEASLAAAHKAYGRAQILADRVMIADAAGSELLERAASHRTHH
jgi:hypothetical protein